MEKIILFSITSSFALRILRHGIISLYIILSLLFYYIGSNIIIPILYAIGILCFLIVLYYNKISLIKTIIPLILLILFSLINMTFYSQIYFSVLNIISILGITLFIIKYVEKNFINYFLIIISLHFINYVFSGGLPNDYFANRSQNHISAILIS